MRDRVGDGVVEFEDAGGEDGARLRWVGAGFGVRLLKCFEAAASSSASLQLQSAS